MRIPSLHSLVDAVRAIGQQRIAETVVKTANELRRVTRRPVTERTDTSKNQDSNHNK
jgi:hypothetical protein